MDINLTQSKEVPIGDGIDVKEIIREVVNQQTGRYNSFITQFTAGFQDTTLQMYKWLLYPVLTATTEKLEEGLRYREMRDVLRIHHPEGKALNLGNLTQALQAVASLQVKKDIKPIVLDYDQTNPYATRPVSSLFTFLWQVLFNIGQGQKLVGPKQSFCC